MFRMFYLRCRHKFFQLNQGQRSHTLFKGEQPLYARPSSSYRGFSTTTIHALQVKYPRRRCKAGQLPNLDALETRLSGMRKSPSSIRLRGGRSMHPLLTQCADLRHRRARLFVPDPRLDIALFEKMINILSQHVGDELCSLGFDS